MLETYRDDLLAKNRTAERLATIGQVAARIGHELRNPLGVVDATATQHFVARRCFLRYTFPWGTAMARVLIVDDNVHLAENIAEILQMDGHTTRVAASAEEVLVAVGTSVTDVLVTDYRLPGLTGAEFVRHIKKLGLEVRAIVISAYTDDGTMREASDAGATFMAKPIDYRMLSRLVREGNA